jgi:hypothetical protein
MKRKIRQASGLVFALLALVAQLTLAAAVPATTLSMADVTRLCRHDGNPVAPSAPARPMPDCQLCVVCHGASGPFGMLTAAAPGLPQPTTIAIARAPILPPATAPPLRFVTAARPRGPPIPV